MGYWKTITQARLFLYAIFQYVKIFCSESAVQWKINYSVSDFLNQSNIFTLWNSSCWRSRLCCLHFDSNILWMLKARAEAEPVWDLYSPRHIKDTEDLKELCWNSYYLRKNKILFYNTLCDIFRFYVLLTWMYIW